MITFQDTRLLGLSYLQSRRDDMFIDDVYPRDLQSRRDDMFMDVSLVSTYRPYGTKEG